MPQHCNAPRPRPRAWPVGIEAQRETGGLRIRMPRNIGIASAGRWQAFPTVEHLLRAPNEARARLARRGMGNHFAKPPTTTVEFIGATMQFRLDARLRPGLPLLFRQ
jgi:hypothetical protein